MTRRVLSRSLTMVARYLIDSISASDDDDGLEDELELLACELELLELELLGLGIEFY
ncbi:hypothetical protein AGMMS49593_06880 [Endomicrobiia bacterium]|nr:hypothetical protein AGMMS49593_06880 [Endomicrobiia bacterium]